MEFFYVVKATQKSGKQDAVIWFTAKTEARANLQLDVALEDAGIETGRGKDYAKPIRTDFPVVDGLPKEGEVDFTWCDRYELAEDQRTWNVKQQAEDESVDDADIEDSTAEESQQSEQPNLIVVATLPFRQRVLAQFIGDGEYLYHIDAGQKNEIVRLEMDTDDAYVQNLLLAAENVEAFKKAIEHDIHKVVNAVKKVFPVDGKKPELATVIQFLTVWFKTEYIDRGLLVKEWQKGNRVAQIQRTDVKTNAGGGNKTDRNPELVHTLDTLDIDIALATLPMDFNIYDIPGGVFRRAKEIVAKNESPFKEWSVALRKRAGILDYSRAAIFALIRSAEENTHHFPELLSRYINKNLTETDHQHPTEETLAAAGHVPEKSWENEINEKVAAEQKAVAEQPKIASMGNGVFSIDGLMGDQQTQTHTDDRSPVNEDTTSHVQMEETVSDEEQTGDEVQSGESSLETGEESYTGQQADVSQNTDSVAQNSDSVNQTDPLATQTEPETQSDEPAVVYPAYFEPGRYEGLPNEVYHAANGISSTQVKDARVSLMYFNARHVEKTIIKERSPVLDMGNLVHTLALQPELLDAEFSVEPLIPEGAFTTTATIRAFIDEYNASLPAILSADDIKTLLEEYNATLPAQVPLGGSAEETGQSYMSLPEDYQRIEADQKQTAAAMKACIKEYNATLPAQVKTSGSRDALLEQLAIINPDLVAQEAQKPQPLKVSGTKADLIQTVKSVNPDAVFADELLDAWRENPQGKVLVTRQQLSTALAIQSALLAHPTAGMLLQHPSRAVEVSYFGFDDETGLEVRVRPDLEIDLDGVRIGADLKTISMWNIKQEGLRAKLHREIIDRDYHLSAAMYCETAALDQFFWIFVNKDENYHWIAIIEASAELLELGMLEYRKAMRAIATGFDTGEWPAPITADYTDELNDFDLRRLEALRTQA
ncbi:PD-(D/E)XK nuclease-like domain-containing protein [Citrobacter freundii]|uniref:PD-(D/E)XK nuclease-like domain-containing protein n=1 Tax=Citrobacter freundii TaxID=546 RepID=A0AAN4IG09_CITFR|nr:RecE family exodeoxyribonuclease [Citrobacter freundii]ASG44031.1 exodeoxyribonuclease VIII [Citrobacter freundii]EKV1032044.1 PD-(D/E)XK nuclease-like domain-containing protein [Citrobacter freundii]EKV4649402.1 PD-(D/E)XK nuclease-like domain-containing protein [Citrobacter freundii]EKW5567457.1 PD-(D/E)XK nuclease-like domain-containing protein [Citrobacter freundii]EKW7209817.1 PD-(D/E)XK nuclease-like domain-containing protein [Citrobacter freundii]